MTTTCQSHAIVRMWVNQWFLLSFSVDICHCAYSFIYHHRVLFYVYMLSLGVCWCVTVRYCIKTAYSYVRIDMSTSPGFSLRIVQALPSEPAFMLTCTRTTQRMSTDNNVLNYTVFRKKHPHTFSFISPWMMCRFKQKFQWIYLRNGRFCKCKNYIFIAADDVIMMSYL